MILVLKLFDTEISNRLGCRFMRHSKLNKNLQLWQNITWSWDDMNLKWIYPHEVSPTAYSTKISSSSFIFISIWTCIFIHDLRMFSSWVFLDTLIHTKLMCPPMLYFSERVCVCWSSMHVCVTTDIAYVHDSRLTVLLQRVFDSRTSLSA